MSNQFGGGRRQEMPTPPRGWPIGSYETYAEAQRAVDFLSDGQFPVEDVTIVGVDLMQVERVLGRLTWAKVIGGGVISGAWLGSFFALIGGLVVGEIWAFLFVGVTAGIAFGVVTAAVPYAASRGRRDFASTMQLVARRYDVLCEPRNAERGRELLTTLQQRPPG